MNVSSLRVALLAGLALPLGLATASLAQDAPTTQIAGASAGDHHWDPAARRAHMAEHLSTVLQLQPSQQSALAAYLDAIKPPGDMKQRIDQAQGMEHMRTPERLDRMMARFDEMHSRMVARIAATKQFYTQLSPSQQKAFDDLAPMMMHRFGGGRGGMDGRHGDGGGWGHRMGPDGQSPG